MTQALGTPQPSPALPAGLLLLGHFLDAVSTQWLPVLLLASQGFFALLAMLLSLLLGCSCLAWGKSTLYYMTSGASPLMLACQGPFASGCQWNHTACASTFRLLSTSLHACSVLQVLGYRLSLVLFGP